MGSSKSILPCSTNCMTAVVQKILEMEPTLKVWSVVAGLPSLVPMVSAHQISPSTMMA